jgi:hypothetical protein
MRYELEHGQALRLLTLTQAIVAALEPPSTKDAEKKKKGKKCSIL